MSVAPGITEQSIAQLQKGNEPQSRILLTEATATGEPRDSADQRTTDLAQTLAVSSQSEWLRPLLAQAVMIIVMVVVCVAVGYFIAQSAAPGELTSRQERSFQVIHSDSFTRTAP